jgi:hypothetical protein
MSTPAGPVASISLAGVTAVIVVNGTHPIDTFKTRLQAIGPGFSLKTMIKQEGIGAFYKGINAAWLREGTYASVRLGGYAPIRDALGAHENSHFLLKFLAGSISGSLGSFVGNPFDVMKTLMMTSPKWEKNWCYWASYP